MAHIRVPVRLGALRTSVRESPAAAAVVVSDRESDAALFSSSAARVCRVCTQHAARYTCPRCNAPYCGVACFQRHGDACTERFYEELVRGAAALDDVDGRDGGKRAVGELLARVKRFQDESAAAQVDNDDEEEEEEEEALERLAALALADEQQLSLDDLTPAQRRQFLAEVADGRLGKFVTLWQPWWRLAPHVYARETAGRRRQLVIQEISSSADEQQQQPPSLEEEDEAAAVGAVLIESSAFPAEIFTDAAARGMPTSLEALLGGRAPAPALRFHLAEILFSYALVLRTFNGDWGQAAGEAAALLLHLSAVLASGSAAATLDAADCVLRACLRKRVDVAYDGDGVDTSASASSETNQRVVRDVTLLLASRVFLLDALSDAHAMVAASVSQLLAAAGGGRKSERQLRRRLELVGKKLQFFQTWVFHSPEQHFQATARELELAAAELASETIDSARR